MKNPDAFKKVAVIGCGFIGYSWGVVFARNGLAVSMYNRKSKTLDTVKDRMKEALEFLRDEGMIEAHAVRESLDRITVTHDPEEAVRDADYIQECLWEDLELKREMFERLTAIVPADVPIGSSCSGLRITDIASRVKHHPERCIVAHPTNPPHLIPFMEISGDNASEEVKRTVYRFMESLGQKPILCKEVYGYVLNRIQLSLIQEALYLVKEGICNVEAVERALTDGLGLRWAFTGPYGVEELNSASLEEGLEKYKDYMIEFFMNQQKKLADYDEAFIKKAAAEFKPLMNGKSHDEYLKWRDKMVIRTRMLKRNNP
ncbi:MAG: 3-hydroxyacyl-CoA dehydrogenase family protein [Clostridiales Family XIII bacterium]|jgi:3-hydroxypropionate dehydrogenase (NADP+)|nr:3-hydroxyacyl-CoA dehydrogenase family protein [Clostridiales Family XIII bacterium]